MTAKMTSELSLARRHDDEGRHDEAVNALARAAGAGDVEAMTQLGKRLVIGDRAPCLPRDGTRLLIDAANRGGAEAAGKLSLLLATGAFIEQSWLDAIDALIKAAEWGWIEAQDQLRVLAAAGGTDRVREDDDRSADAWRRLGRGVDIGFWTSPSAGTTLNDEPKILSYSGFAPAEVCRWLMRQSAGKLERAQVYDARLGETTTNEIRTNSAALFNLMNTDLVTVLVQARIAATVAMPFANLEAAAILHYGVGEEIGRHYDFVDPRAPNYPDEIEQAGQRIVTFLVYLNDDYEGGETEFPDIGLSVRGVLGNALYFSNTLADGQPDLRAAHAGRPPRRGAKWVLSQFIRAGEVLRTA